MAVQFGLRQAQACERAAPAGRRDRPAAGTARRPAAGGSCRSPGRRRRAAPAARAGRRQPRGRPSRWCSIIHSPAQSLASSS
jgi:hypothetical protein